MAKSQQTYGKKEREKKRLKKQEDKRKKRVERRDVESDSSLEGMLVYVDENGHLVDTPPDPSLKIEIDPEDIVLGIPKKEEGDEEEIDPVHEGTVDFFDSSKGFGFIIDAVNKERYFVHVSGTTEDIVEGNRVQYELEKGQRGWNAVKVKKV